MQFHLNGCRPGDPDMTESAAANALPQRGSALPGEVDVLIVQSAFEQSLVVDAAIAKSAKEAEEFWSIRDSSAELDRIFGRCVTFDVSIPVPHIEKFVIECCRKLQAALPGARALAFGHIADSNIHLACRTNDPVQPKQIIEEVVYECVGRWGGSISAEHGIGMDKRRYLPLSRNPAEIGPMQTVKLALDPYNLMNPAKVIPDREAGAVR